MWIREHNCCIWTTRFSWKGRKIGDNTEYMFWRYLKWNILLRDSCFVNNLKFKGKWDKAQTLHNRAQSRVILFQFLSAFWGFFCFSALPLPSLLYVQNNLVLNFGASNPLLTVIHYWVIHYSHHCIASPSSLVPFCGSHHKRQVGKWSEWHQSLNHQLLLTTVLWWNALPFLFQIFCEMLKWWPCSTHQRYPLLCGLVGQKLSATPVTDGCFVAVWYGYILAIWGYPSAFLRYCL